MAPVLGPGYAQAMPGCIGRATRKLSVTGAPVRRLLESPGHRDQRFERRAASLLDLGDPFIDGKRAGETVMQRSHHEINRRRA